MQDMVSVFGKAILDELKTRGRKVWEHFVRSLASLQQQISFDINGKLVDPEVVMQVYERLEGVTSYLQRVMNVLLMQTPDKGHCTVDMIDDAVDYLLDLNSENYETLWSQMSERQRLVFRAITMEGKAIGVTGGAFIKKYGLWSPSNVMSALKALLDKDFVTQEKDAYQVYDKFFALWLRRQL